jgi:hypothetical protein
VDPRSTCIAKKTVDEDVPYSQLSTDQAPVAHLLLLLPAAAASCLPPLLLPVLLLPLSPLQLLAALLDLVATTAATAL